jgi:hypothetical protein
VVDCSSGRQNLLIVFSPHQPLVHNVLLKPNQNSRLRHFSLQMITDLNLISITMKNLKNNTLNITHCFRAFIISIGKGSKRRHPIFIIFLFDLNNHSLVNPSTPSKILTKCCSKFIHIKNYWKKTT